MKLLVLFSAWIPDASDNSVRWANYYYDLLNTSFSSCHKIIAINHGCDSDAAAKFRELPNLLALSHVPPSLHVDSDAAGYQLCLKLARDISDSYDMVLFLHTKGVSKPFDSLEGFRWLFGNTLLSPEIAERAEKTHPDSLHAVFLHPPTFNADFRKFAAYLHRLDPTAKPVMANVTYTVYYVSTTLLRRVLNKLPMSFYETNINTEFDRFYFELIWPSLLLSLHGGLSILGDAKYNPKLNSGCSSNYDLSHNTQMVRDYHQLYLKDVYFHQPIAPMIFGPVDEISRINIRFS